MNILIFCSAYCKEEKYLKAAEEVSEILAKAGNDLVFGGSDVSLMKTVADAFAKHQRKIYGITIPIYKDSCRQNLTETLVVQTVAERKSLIIQKSDAVLVLPGGIGTLDELGDALELKKQGVYPKPVVVLNTDGFYDGLKMQLDKMSELGFIPMPLEELLVFVNKPDEVLGKIVI